MTPPPPPRSRRKDASDAPRTAPGPSPMQPLSLRLPVQSWQLSPNRISVPPPSASDFLPDDAAQESETLAPFLKACFESLSGNAQPHSPTPRQFVYCLERRCNCRHVRIYGYTCRQHRESGSNYGRQRRQPCACCRRGRRQIRPSRAIFGRLGAIREELQQNQDDKRGAVRGSVSSKKLNFVAACIAVLHALSFYLSQVPVSSCISALWGKVRELQVCIPPQ